MLGIIEKIDLEKIPYSILFENKYIDQESIKSSTCRMLHAFYVFNMHFWMFFVLKI